MPICQLCKNDRKLIKAHIIPRAFWRLPQADKDAAKIISNTAGSWPKTTRIGVYDEEILCEACDGKLGVLDQHATESLLQCGPSETFKMNGASVGRIYGAADPKILTKFIASVAWRAAVSQQDFFKSVALGTYENTIALWLNDSCSAPAGIRAVLAEFDVAQVPMLDPHQTRDEGVRFWVIYADRFIFYMQADKRTMSEPMRLRALEAGKPVTSIVRSWHNSKERRILIKIAQSNPGAFRRINR